MTLDELQAEIRRLTTGIEHPRVGAALALAEECGEVMRCILDREYYGKHDDAALQDEIGDVLVALAEVCDRFGISLAASAEGAVAKLERKAPKWKEELGERLVELRRRMDGPDAP
ncbi:MAG: MazG nucleotide pyrophosphohydrolase domain-containing protein [Planctomycetota bacterium]|nr:MazG nucleotide pyrophosphohydrolase domain-containing protein [Planctomycetota bacterium]